MPPHERDDLAMAARIIAAILFFASGYVCAGYGLLILSVLPHTILTIYVVALATTLILVPACLAVRWRTARNALAAGATVAGLVVLGLAAAYAADLLDGFHIMRWSDYAKPAFSALPGILAIALVAPTINLRPRGHCDQCGYDVTALPDTTCPECGADISHVRPPRPLVRGVCDRCDTESDDVRPRWMIHHVATIPIEREVLCPRCRHIERIKSGIGLALLLALVAAVLVAVVLV